MNFNFLKNISIPALIVSYFSFCGGLYLLSYWSAFGVDALNLIQLQDIIKAVFQPLFVNVKGLLVFIFAIISLNLLGVKSKDKWSGIKNIHYWIHLFFLILFCLVFYSKCKFFENMFLPILLLYSKSIVELLDNKFLPKVDIDLKKNIVIIAIMIPGLLYSEGKRNSKDLRLNRKKNMVMGLSINKIDSTSKSFILHSQFIGYIGDLAVFESKTQMGLIYVNRGEILSLELLGDKVDSDPSVKANFIKRYYQQIEARDTMVD